MRLWSILFLAFACSLEAQTISVNSYRFGTSSLNTGLVSFWALEEASGTRVDSEPTGTPQDLTDNNTVTQAAGKIGNAAYFDRNNTEFLTRADSADISTGNIDFMVGGWFKATTLAFNGVIASHWSTVGNQRAWRLWFNSTTGRMQFGVSADGITEAAVVELTSFGVPATNTWYFILGHHDSVNDEIGISINNATFNTLSYSGGVLDSTATLTLGARGLGADLYDGAIDQLGLWKRILTPAEITALYNAGAGKFCCPFSSP